MVDQMTAQSRHPVKVLAIDGGGVRGIIPSHVLVALEDLGELDLTDIHWVIVGGESGGKARPMKQEWVDNIHRQCDDFGSAFFFKQWGGWGADGVKRSKKANGRLLNGQTWDEIPLLNLA